MNESPILHPRKRKLIESLHTAKLGMSMTSAYFLGMRTNRRLRAKIELTE